MFIESEPEVVEVTQGLTIFFFFMSCSQWFFWEGFSVFLESGSISVTLIFKLSI